MLTILQKPVSSDGGLMSSLSWRRHQEELYTDTFENQMKYIILKTQLIKTIIKKYFLY